VDDEPLARLNLSSLLEPEPDVEIVGQCADAASAVRAIGALEPELLFLDVQMPGMNGFEVLRRSVRFRPPAVVFVTAHDQFAVQAFDCEAFDYLLKPFRRERFERVLQRLREHLRSSSASPPPAAAPAADRLVLQSGGRLLLLDLDQLDYVRAAANYVHLHVGADTHTLRDTLAAFEQRLPAGRFVRIHRSFVVNLGALSSLEPAGGGEFVARLRNGRELPVGPTYAAGLRRALRAMAP